MSIHTNYFKIMIACDTQSSARMKPAMLQYLPYQAKQKIGFTMTRTTTTHTLAPLSKREWDAFFLNLWPYYQIGIASLKNTFIQPIGRDGDSYFGLWLISKETQYCPVIRICTQKENTHVVANNLSEFSIEQDERTIDERFSDHHLWAFLDCFND
jgi:hypothetical protein